jgi:hypothetical protein
MSYYKNLLQELPKRNKILLDKFYQLEKGSIESYEVTLLISLAMPVFVITTEIMVKPPENYVEIKNKLTQKLNKQELNQGIFKGISEGWLYELDESERNLYEIDSLRNSIPIIYSDQEKISILRQIRNSLSHGEIKFTQYKNGQIDNILLKSENRKNGKVEGSHLNLIPVDDFKKLLSNWCDFLVKENSIIPCLNLLKNAA